MSTYLTVIFKRSAGQVVAILAIRNLVAAATSLGLFLSSIDAYKLSVASIIVGVHVAASIISAPIRGRIVDKFGRARTLIPLLFASSALLLLLSLALIGGKTAVPIVLGIAVVQSITTPPIDAVIRTEWKNFSHSDYEKRAFHSIDSILEEAGFLAGPLLMALFQLFISPNLAFVLLSLLSVSTSAWLVLLPSMRIAMKRPQDPGEAHPLVKRSFFRILMGPIVSIELARIVIPLILMGAAIAAATAPIPAIVPGGERNSVTSLMFSLISVGGLIGGLWFGTSKWGATERKKQLILVIWLAVGFLPVVIYPSLLSLSFSLIASGMAVTPLFINSYLLLDSDLPKSVEHEANTWVPVSYNIGYSIVLPLAGASAENESGYSMLILAVVIGVCLLYSIIAAPASSGRR